MFRSATCPRIISWPVINPEIALEKKTASISFGPMPASLSASPTASSASERTPRSEYLPKRVIPTPATVTRSLLDIAILPVRRGRR